jgi:hypothetical protein
MGLLAEAQNRNMVSIKFEKKVHLFPKILFNLFFTDYFK